MRIEAFRGRDSLGVVSRLEVELTPSEAQQLRDFVHQMVEDPDVGHAHVMSADLEHEITVWIEGHP